MKTLKKYLSIAALALVGAAVAGCSKGNDIIDQPQQPEAIKSNVVTLTTTVGFDETNTTRALNIDYDAKTLTKTFAAGDQIALIYTQVSGATAKSVSKALNEGNIETDGKSAKFTFELTNPDKTKNVTYIYPASMAKDDGEVNYAALNSQDGTLTTIANSLDLATYSSAWNGDALPTADLENGLAIIAYTILENAATPSDITNTITGMTINDGTNNYAVSRSAAAGPIYVAIRPTSGANIEYTATVGTKSYMKSVTSKTYTAGDFYQLGLRMNDNPLPGEFSVSDKKEVTFSKGNLQATYNGSTWNWHFAANQWDFIGNAEGNTKVSGTSPFVSEYSETPITVDLFGWVGASSTWDGVNMYGITSSTATSAKDGYGDAASENLKADWGTNIGTGWRTLTQAEWTYLFNERTVKGGTGSGYSYTLGQSVNEKSGIVIYPDNYDGAIYSSGSDWSTFEAAGCVFLPAAGNRLGANVANVNDDGFYWSSTSAEEYNAYNVHFTSSALFPSAGFSRSTGCSVRLVRNLN